MGPSQLHTHLTLDFVSLVMGKTTRVSMSFVSITANRSLGLKLTFDNVSCLPSVHSNVIRLRFDGCIGLQCLALCFSQLAWDRNLERDYVVASL